MDTSRRYALFSLLVSLLPLAYFPALLYIQFPIDPTKQNRVMTVLAVLAIVAAWG